MRLLRRCNLVRARRLRKLRAIRRWDQEAFSEYDLSVLAMIGTMTITWAGIEMILNQFIAWYHQRGGKAIRKDLPRMLTVKLDYLKAVEPDIRWTPEQRVTFREIRLKLAELNQFRINMIHGYVYRRNRRNMVWRALIHKEDGDRLSRYEVTYTNLEIVTAIQGMSDLADLMSKTYAPILGLVAKR